MIKRTDQFRTIAARTAFSLVGLLTLIPAWAGSGEATSSSELSDTLNNTVYILVGTAIFQMVFIMVIAGIMKNLGASSDLWSKYKNGAGKAGMLLVLFAFPTFTFAAGSEVPFLLMKTADLFWLLISVNSVLFAIVVVLLGIMKSMIRSMRGEEEVEAIAAIAEPSFIETFSKSLTNRVDMEHEDDVLLDHEYDGIHELDNVLPPWWLWLFYGSIVFAVVYLFGYHVFSVWPLSEEEYAIEMEEGRQSVLAYQATLTDRVDENTVTYVVDPGALKNGEEIYTQSCVACHMADGAGGIGPNFTDEFWIHGCDIKDVFSTIKYGVPEKGMISWKTQLKPPEIQNVASYILYAFQTGSPVANGKEPQGEVCEPFATEGSDATPEDAEMPTDSVTNDTLITAMLR